MQVQLENALDVQHRTSTTLSDLFSLYISTLQHYLTVLNLVAKPFSIKLFDAYMQLGTSILKADIEHHFLKRLEEVKLNIEKRFGSNRRSISALIIEAESHLLQIFEKISWYKEQVNQTDTVSAIEPTISKTELMAEMNAFAARTLTGILVLLNKHTLTSGNASLWNVAVDKSEASSHCLTHFVEFADIIFKIKNNLKLLSRDQNEFLNDEVAEHDLDTSFHNFTMQISSVQKCLDDKFAVLQNIFDWRAQVLKDIDLGSNNGEVYQTIIIDRNSILPKLLKTFFRGYDGIYGNLVSYFVEARSKQKVYKGIKEPIAGTLNDLNVLSSILRLKMAEPLKDHITKTNTHYIMYYKTGLTHFLTLLDYMDNETDITNMLK